MLFKIFLQRALSIFTHSVFTSTATMFKRTAPKNASHFSSIIVCFFLIYDSCQNINIKFDQKNEIFRYFVICLHKSIKAKWKKYLTFWKALGCFYHIRSYVKNSYTLTLIFTLHKTSSLSSKLELFYRETHSLRKTFEINLDD